MASVTLSKINKVYEGKAQFHALHDVDLNVNDGEFVVFVGPSGCGKSTLLRVIAGLEDITDGDLMIDGQRVNDQTPKERGIGMVFQSYALYPHMTVRENMEFGLKLAKQDKAMIRNKVEDVAKTLQLDALLDRKPKELSGGQRQRIALARAFLKDAPILVLDEATSALDSEVEAAIQDSLSELMEGKTVLAIAHRLSTISAMDRIIVMEDGRIVEEGSHDVLLAKGGLYARFWARQSGGFIQTEAAE